MNPKYMLDTNICIYLMKHQPPEVRERFAQCFVGDVVIAEPESIVPVGVIPPDSVKTPGVLVDHLLVRAPRPVQS